MFEPTVYKPYCLNIWYNWMFANRMFGLPSAVGWFELIQICSLVKYVIIYYVIAKDLFMWYANENHSITQSEQSILCSLFWIYMYKFNIYLTKSKFKELLDTNNIRNTLIWVVPGRISRSPFSHKLATFVYWHFMIMIIWVSHMPVHD